MTVLVFIITANNSKKTLNSVSWLIFAVYRTDGIRYNVEGSGREFENGV